MSDVRRRDLPRPLTLDVGFLASVARDALAGSSVRAACGPVFLWGAGSHTDWLLYKTNLLDDLPISAVIDDEAAPEQRARWLDVLRPEHALSRFGQPALVVLSTDSEQVSMARRVREVFGASVETLDLYAALPAGPYVRRNPMLERFRAAVTDGPEEPAWQHPTETCLRRAVSRLASAVSERGLARVVTVGPFARTRVMSEVLRSHGLDIVADEREADAAVVFDGYPRRMTRPEPTEQRSGLPVFSLWTGDRLWIDRRADTQHTPESLDPVRIAIRHQGLLGDVILSQGIIPERIKSELYPNAEITLVTSVGVRTRPNSTSTGWAAAVADANPFIDRIVPLPGDFPSAEWDEIWSREEARADLAYHLVNPPIYHHIADNHAMQVELPPGRTDIKIHLSDEDRAVATEVLGPRPGVPLVAVNMNLLIRRVRGGFSEAWVTALCERLESETGSRVVWVGSHAFGKYPRLAHGDRFIDVREQAAVLSMCDLHITCQGGGANLSMAVGTPTLSLTGLHPAYREGPAFLANRYIADPSRHHAELSRYEGCIRFNTFRAEPRSPVWQIEPGETAASVWDFDRVVRMTNRRMDDLTQDVYQRIRSLTVDDVLTAAELMIRCQSSGDPVPDGAEARGYFGRAISA